MIARVCAHTRGVRTIPRVRSAGYRGSRRPFFSIIATDPWTRRLAKNNGDNEKTSRRRRRRTRIRIPKVVYLKTCVLHFSPSLHACMHMCSIIIIRIVQRNTNTLYSDRAAINLRFADNLDILFRPRTLTVCVNVVS